MFEALNPLEALMEEAVRDSSRVNDFYKLLLDTELIILAPEAKMEPGRRRALKYKEAVNIAVVEFQGRKWHPAFTAQKRVEAYIKEPETCLSAKARNLFDMLPGSNFWINPLSECQKPMTAEEIAKLMSGEMFVAPAAGPSKAVGKKSGKART